MIARRFVVSFTPPEGKPAGKLAIDLPGRRCTATVLPDPFERPDAIAGVAPPAPRAWVRLHATQRKNDDPACAGGPTDAPWDWPLRPDAAHLTGCVLDVVQAPGALRRAPGGKKPRTLDFAPMRLAAREVTIEAPHVDRLPENLAEALDALSRSDTAAPGARSPRIVEGSALLTQRARIAASLYAARADYFAFAKAQLAELADADLSAAERDLRRAFPDLAATQITAAARASRAGRRALESVRRPTDADMARVLAAWLGDTPAWMAFRDWELLLVDARLAGPADPGVLARWGAMRARFGQTDSIRIAAPLVLLHDRGRDLIGFRRIVLPLPIDLDEAVRRPDAWDKRVEDRLPDRPFALDVLEAALADPDAAARIAAGAFHAIDVTYRPLEPAAKTVQSGPFRHCRVRVDLEGAAARLRLESEVTFADDGALRVEPPDATFTPR